MRHDDGDEEAVPADLRATTLEVGGVELLIVSYPVEPNDLFADTSLTKAEAEVAELAIEGKSNAEIAAARDTSVRTVANQMAAILRKLGLGSRRELAVSYVRGSLCARGVDGPEGVLG